MAYVTQDNSGKAMADDDRDDEAEERNEREERDEGTQPQKAYQPAASKVPAPTGFFHVYKSGQGYWTRMGSAAGALLIILLFCYFYWDQIRPRFEYLAAREH